MVIPLVVALLLALGKVTGAAERAPDEYEVKAAFLYNFARYVRWPPRDATRPSPTFVITVVGRDPFGALLDEAIRDADVDGRPLEVRRITNPGEIGPSDIVFVGEPEHVAAVLARVAGTPTLTVGEDEHFAERGGVIGFRTQRDRVRLEVNLGAAERAGFRISAELLKLAHIVGPQRR